MRSRAKGPIIRVLQRSGGALIYFVGRAGAAGVSPGREGSLINIVTEIRMSAFDTKLRGSSTRSAS